MVKGFKGFNQDLTCRGFQYEIGKTYEYNGKIELYCTGFHFCRELNNVHTFYNLKESRICEIEANGEIIDDETSVCSHIKIIRELSCEEIAAAINTGKDNTGLFNSGDCNSGDFCSCNFSSGIFMTKKITYEAFNKQLSKEEYDALIESEGFTLLCRFRLCLFKTRTTKNGQKHLACLSYKASWRVFWQTLTPMQKLTIKKIPHFDADVFYEITGISLGKLPKKKPFSSIKKAFEIIEHVLYNFRTWVLF